MLRKRLAFHKIEPAILHMKDKFNASCVVLETAGVGLAIGNALVNCESARRWLCPTTPRSANRTRRRPDPKIDSQRVYLPISAPWLETFALFEAADRRIP